MPTVPKRFQNLQLMRALCLTSLLISFFGCQSSRQVNPGKEPNVTRARALQIAKQEFSKLYPGPLREYQISISDDPDENAWYVLFTGTGDYAVPGGHTPILVDKVGGRVQVLEGK